MEIYLKYLRVKYILSIYLSYWDWQNECSRPLNDFRLKYHTLHYWYHAENRRQSHNLHQCWNIGTNFSKILSEIQALSLKEMHWKCHLLRPRCVDTYIYAMLHSVFLFRIHMLHCKRRIIPISALHNVYMHCLNSNQCPFTTNTIHILPRRVFMWHGDRLKKNLCAFISKSS